MREARQLPGGLFACLSLEGPEVRMHPAAEVTSAFESNLFFFFLPHHVFVTLIGIENSHLSGYCAQHMLIYL